MFNSIFKKTEMRKWERKDLERIIIAEKFPNIVDINVNIKKYINHRQDKYKQLPIIVSLKTIKNRDDLKSN